jgi:hypothetical protein
MEKYRNYKIKDCDLIILGNRIKFEYPIKKTVEISGTIIVLLNKPLQITYNENVFAVGLENKKIIWQISPRKYYGENCPFTDIDIIRNQLRLFNWCGVYLDVDPATGKVLEVGDSK